MYKFILFALLFIFGACTTDVSKFDNSKEATYAYNFEQRYGKIAPDQDWGFGVKTRTVIKENHDFVNKKVIIPEAASQEEIVMVTKWFNSNPNPKTLNLDWCNFWIIPVSKSNHAGHMNQVFVGEEINDINGGTAWKRLVEDGNTKIFKYHNSETGQEISDKYTIQKIGEHYYLAFYYYGTKWDNGTKTFGDNDDLYNDWIFRLEPAVYQDTYRIIAEDLGNTGDFDFNDVVFDFHKTWDSYIITLQAVGGTLPLYIGDKEVHEAFGVNTSTFVNTISVDTPPVMFKTSSLDITVVDSEAVSYTLKSECGKAPQKICVPVSYKWTKERQSIEEKYPKFKDWVGNTEINWIN